MAPRKSSGAAAPSSSTNTSKHKTFSFSKQLEGAISKSPTKNSPARANDKPHFSIRRTVNQTTGEESQNRQALFRSRYVIKEMAMEALTPLFLSEKPRWMPNVQPDGRSVFSVFVRTVTQARNILSKLREVEGPESSTLYLPADVSEEEFAGARPAHIDIVPINDKMMLFGMTYPLLDKIRAIGFDFERGIEVENQPAFDAWTISTADFDASGRTDLLELLDIWGWTYMIYDNAE